MNNNTHAPHYDLTAIAHQAMIDRGLEPDFPPDALRQTDALQGPAADSGSDIRDLRDRVWISIDNDDSLDLDQLTVAEPLEGDTARILVAIADVDALVRKGSPIDEHARYNTTSVYTAARIFPMLPEKLSTDLTSLRADVDRLAMVIAYIVNADGTVGDSEIYRALVRNKAKLAYNSVAAWLDGTGPIPPALAQAEGADAQLRLQDSVAQKLKAQRHRRGALDLTTIQAKATIQDDRVVDLYQEPQNRAHEIIEDFMIAANGVTARYLTDKGWPTFRRVVRTPERWDRIRDLAASLGEHLPEEPDVKALNTFLLKRREADPLRFPDLSLAVIKMLGSGEYVVQMPGEEPIGHFGLAVRDYTHSTAPNRRYPDVITQRMLKAALAGNGLPYAGSELHFLADHCTQQEDAARKVERQVGKSAAALLLSSRIGEQFDALVTGATDKGTWARVLTMPVEGKLVSGYRGVDVGDKIRVELVSVDVLRGFIDFALVRALPRDF